jgi:hypothetical protein
MGVKSHCEPSHHSPTIAHDVLVLMVDGPVSDEPRRMSITATARRMLMVQAGRSTSSWQGFYIHMSSKRCRAEFHVSPDNPIIAVSYAFSSFN